MTGSTVGCSGSAETSFVDSSVTAGTSTGSDAMIVTYSSVVVMDSELGYSWLMGTYSVDSFDTI